MEVLSDHYKQLHKNVEKKRKDLFRYKTDLFIAAFIYNSHLRINWKLYCCIAVLVQSNTRAFYWFLLQFITNGCCLHFNISSVG